MGHQPVMLTEVLEAIKPADHEIYVDGTFGAGGYTAALLEASECRVVAIDRDSEAIERAEALKEKYGDRLVFIHGCFGDVESLLREKGFEAVDGFVLDLGVSSMQLDQPERGFSFRSSGPLDMRMDGCSDGQTAADIVNTYAEGELADLIYKYGEERHSRRIAKKIVERRAQDVFETTSDLADVVCEAVPPSKKEDINPATRTFQALRIAVNDELGELEKALSAAESILKPGGRIVVVSFHSLEDRIVKRFLRDKSDAAPRGSRYNPEQHRDRPVFTLLSKKALKPTEDEIAQNARSRSARLRAAIKVEAEAA